MVEIPLAGRRQIWLLGFFLHVGHLGSDRVSFWTDRSIISIDFPFRVDDPSRFYIIIFEPLLPVQDIFYVLDLTLKHVSFLPPLEMVAKKVWLFTLL